MNSQPTEKKKVSAIEMTEGYYPEYIKNSKNLNNPIWNGQMIWIDTFQEEKCEWPINIWKMLNIISHQDNANKNHNEISFLPT